MLYRIALIPIICLFLACSHNPQAFDDHGLDRQKNLLQGVAQPVGIGRLIFFGDSFTDNEGRLLEKTKGLIPTRAYYWQGRFSNGPVWSDYLIQSLRRPALNYAMAGARAHDVNAFAVPGQGIKLLEVPGAPAQLELFSRDQSFRQDDLLLIWLGSNDYLFYADASRVPTYVKQVMELTQAAIDRGARNILVFTLIPFDDVPLDPKGLDGKNFDRRVLETLIDRHNRLLTEEVQKLAHDHPELKLHTISLGHAIRDIRKNAAAYGFTDLKNPCFRGGVLLGSNSPVSRLFQEDKEPLVCEHPRQHLFWDKAHPTTAVHCLAASSVMSQLANLGYITAFDRARAEHVCQQVQ